MNPQFDVSIKEMLMLSAGLTALLRATPEQRVDIHWFLFDQEKTTDQNLIDLKIKVDMTVHEMAQAAKAERASKVNEILPKNIIV